MTDAQRIEELEKAFADLTRLHQETKELHTKELNIVLKDGVRAHDGLVRHYESYIDSRLIRAVTRRVRAWVHRVLGKNIMDNPWERIMRVLEETIELAQSCQITELQVNAIAKYVFERPVGVTNQEAGGVMTCLLAWASTNHVDLEEELIREVARIETIDPEKVRIKQRAKFMRDIGLLPDDPLSE